MILVAVEQAYNQITRRLVAQRVAPAARAILVRKTRPCCCNPGTQSSPVLQLNLCRMKLPYPLSPAATRAGSSSPPRPQISVAHGIRSVTLGHDQRCQRRGNDPAAGGEKDCHHARAALLERSRGQVREGRDFSAETSHEEAHLQEASRSS